MLPKKQPAPPSWVYWECWEWVEAPARWWLMFTEDFVTSSPCDSSGSSRPSNWLHSLFQSHPRNSFSFRNSHSWRRTFPGRAWSPRKGSGESTLCPLIGARWGHLGTPIPSVPPDSRGSNPPGDSSRSKGGPGISTATFHTRFPTSNPLVQRQNLEQATANSIFPMQGTIPGYFTLPWRWRECGNTPCYIPKTRNW